MSTTQSLKPTGHLQIFKQYEDGTEELHFDENNIITSGMGVGLSHMFAASGASSIVDYQIRNFLVGSGYNPDNDVLLAGDGNYGVSSFKLKAPLTVTAPDVGIPSENPWGPNTSLITELLTPIENRSIGGAARPFARIIFSNINKVTDTSVRYTLVLDRNTLNGKYLNEVGLFMRNPSGSIHINPILVAYRPFTEITKTSDFSLLFLWTLQF